MHINSPEVKTVDTAPMLAGRNWVVLFLVFVRSSAFMLPHLRPSQKQPEMPLYELLTWKVQQRLRLKF